MASKSEYDAVSVSMLVCKMGLGFGDERKRLKAGKATAFSLAKIHKPFLGELWMIIECGDGFGSLLSYEIWSLRYRN